MATMARIGKFRGHREGKQLQPFKGFNASLVPYCTLNPHHEGRHHQGVLRLSSIPTADMEILHEARFVQSGE